MLKKILLGSVLFFANPTFADSLNISTPYKTLKEGITVKDNIAYLYGDIVFGFDDQFSNIPKNVNKLILTSNGGFIAVGEKIAREVKARNMSTIVIGYCYSACTLIFSAGRQRIAKHDADFIVHSVKTACANGKENCSYSQEEIDSMEKSNERLIALYDMYGVNSAFTRSAVKWPQKQNEKR